MSIEESIQENAESISELSRIVYMLAEGREIAASDLPYGWWGKVIGENDAYAEADTWWRSTYVRIFRRESQPSGHLEGVRVIIVPESEVPEWALAQRRGV